MAQLHRAQQRTVLDCYGRKELIKSGMSGSPFLDDDGAAIGLVSTGSGDGFNMNPSLADCLPPWLLRKSFGFSRRKRQAF
jgi:hypothetical protein